MNIASDSFDGNFKEVYEENDKAEGEYVGEHESDKLFAWFSGTEWHKKE